MTYVAAVGDSTDSMQMRYENENIWMTQKMIAVLYDVDVRTINYHLKKYLRMVNYKRIQLSKILG